MKTLNLWTIKLTFFTTMFFALCMVSCSDDVESYGLTAQQMNTETSLQRKMGGYPENADNQFDIAGQLLYDFCEISLNQPIPMGTAGTILQIEGIANLNIEYLTLKPFPYISPGAARIDLLAGVQQSGALGIVNNSTLSAKAKSSMNNFLITLLDYHDSKTDFQTIYDYIIGFENDVLTDAGYNSNDRKIMLTTTSIARYGFYFAKKHRRKPRDRDWEISWGHIVAGFEGAESSTAKAVIMAASCNMVANK